MTSPSTSRGTSPARSSSAPPSAAPDTSATTDGAGLLALSRVVTSTLDLQTVLDESFAALRRLVAFNGGAIQLVDDGHLVAAATDPPAAPEALTVRIPVGRGVSGTIAATGDPIYIPDITVDERVHPEGRKKGLSGGVRSYFGAPLIQHGTPVGVVQIDSTDIDAFSAADRDTVLSFLPTITAAVQNARLYEAQQTATERLEEIERLQRDFLSMVSHELRTPMVKINGFAQLLQQGGLPAERMSELGNQIAVAGEHLASLIGDVLEVSGIGTHQTGDAWIDCGLPRLIDDAVADVRAPIRRISIKVAESARTVHAPAARLTRILGLLIDNAVKFSTDAVDVRGGTEGDVLVLSVHDNGIGIAPEDQERIFDRFVQVDQSATRRYSGIGVGLFLARSFCERLGIDLAVQSALGEGSTFTLRVPQSRA